MSMMEELDHLRISLEAIISGTNNFGDGNKIGEGGFGKVYRGELSDSNGSSKTVAVKRLNCNGYQGQQEFLTEIIMLSSYKHDNLVSLQGFCDEDDEKILVYEYMSRGSLDKYVSDTDSLTWVQRLRICIGAAKGFEYLHSHVGPQHRVIHRDIKSSNILLDDNWEAKISDFGLSKIGPANQNMSLVITQPAGTCGYLDPLYEKTGILTKESDVYSFGVVLFEVLCGRLACVGEYNDERRFLKRYVRHCYKLKTRDVIIDQTLMKQMVRSSMDTFSAIAYRCLQKRREDRPEMTLVVDDLENALQFQLVPKTKEVHEHTYNRPSIKHSSHVHRLNLIDRVDYPYSCSSCNEPGFTATYTCSSCNFFLHMECATASSHADYPFSQNCKLELRHAAPTRHHRCEACGKTVLGLHYKCKGSFIDRYLHPFCLKYSTVVGWNLRTGLCCI